MSKDKREKTRPHVHDEPVDSFDVLDGSNVQNATMRECAHPGCKTLTERPHCPFHGPNSPQLRG